MDDKLLKLVLKVAGGLLVLIVGVVLVAHMVTTVAADEIVVKQNILDGHLQVWNTPGVHWQNFGKVTRYKKSNQLWFSVKEDEGKKTDDSIRVRFNDGGHGNVSGSLRYSLPTDYTHMIALHSTYGSMDAIDHELVRQVVNKSVYMTGPLMSSRESYAERRNDLINFIADQVTYGVYRTERKTVELTDPLTNQTKTVDIVQPKLKDGAPNGVEREEESPIQKFAMGASNMTINSIEYDPVVEQQIKQQQEAIMAVQQSILLSKKAEQDAQTTKLQGEANAAKAKWDQEVEKATAVTAAEKEKEVAVTQAQKDKEVAALALDTAKLNAEQTITTAKADAEQKRLATSANNNLQDRLAAYVDISKAWAAAYGAQRQTPDVSLGNGGGTNTNAAMELLNVKLARDLGVSPKP